MCVRRSLVAKWTTHNKHSNNYEHLVVVSDEAGLRYKYRSLQIVDTSQLNGFCVVQLASVEVFEQ